MHWRLHSLFLRGGHLFDWLKVVNNSLRLYFRCHVMHSTMHQERNYGLLIPVGRGKWATTIIHLTTNTSPISERKKKSLGMLWPRLTISLDQTRECYTTKIPTCFLVYFFHLLSIKSTGLLLCHWALAVWEIINFLIWFSSTNILQDVDLILQLSEFPLKAKNTCWVL